MAVWSSFAVCFLYCSYTEQVLEQDSGLGVRPSGVERHGDREIRFQPVHHGLLHVWHPVARSNRRDPSSKWNSEVITSFAVLKFLRRSWKNISLSDSFELSLKAPGLHDFDPVCNEWSYRHTHAQTHMHRCHIVDHVWFSCSLALTLIQSRLVEICSPCCLIFPPLATFPGTAPLPHCVAQAGLAWPQRACQVCSLSSSSSNLFPYARAMDSVLQITRAPLPPATAWIQETFNLPLCLLQNGVVLTRPAMCHFVFGFFFVF